MAGIQEWSPFDTAIENNVDGRYANAAYTLIAAGPPRITEYGGAAFAQIAFSGQQGVAFPIGSVQNMNLSQNRQFNRFWEIGSERSYFISGRTMQQMTLARVLYHGPSLLRVLYAYYTDAVPPTVVEPLYANAGAFIANPHDVIMTPGYETLFINLASDLFSQPIGLLIYLKDTNLENLGAMYCETCQIPNHTFMTDAQGTVIQESAAVQFEQVVPVSVSAVGVAAAVAGAL